MLSWWGWHISNIDSESNASRCCSRHDCLFSALHLLKYLCVNALLIVTSIVTIWISLGWEYLLISKLQWSRWLFVLCDCGERREGTPSWTKFFRFPKIQFSANQDNNGFKVSSKWSLPLPATSVNSQFCRTGIQDKQGRLVGTRWPIFSESIRCEHEQV